MRGALRAAGAGARGAARRTGRGPAGRRRGGGHRGGARAGGASAPPGGCREVRMILTNHDNTTGGPPKGKKLRLYFAVTMTLSCKPMREKGRTGMMTSIILQKRTFSALSAFS